MIPSSIPRGLGNVATSTGHKGEKGRRREIARLTELTRLENEAARLEQGLELRAIARRRLEARLQTVSSRIDVLREMAEVPPPAADDTGGGNPAVSGNKFDTIPMEY